VRVSADSDKIEHMFERQGGAGSGSGGGRAEAPAPAGTTACDARAVGAWVADLARDSFAGLSDGERIELLRSLEALKCVAEGAQAQVAVDFDASQRAEQAARDVPPARRGQGVAAQVALARRESPHRGRQHLGLAKVLHAEMPCTWAALRGGWISEWRATLMARETACLSLEHRLLLDSEMAADPAHIESLGDRELVATLRARASELDPAAVTKRRRKAEADRRVTLRPAPDTMSVLTGVLPVASGVAVLAALTAQAESLRAGGDPRSKGQIMADTLIARVTGQPSTQTDKASTGRDGWDPTKWDARPPSPRAPVVPVTVNLVISDLALFGTSEESAQVDGFGAIPAELARELVRKASEEGVARLRRLYATPAGRMVAREAGGRFFPAGLAELIRLRDRTCRTPWCDAPVRDTDHVVAHAGGGATSEENGQGTCEACDHAKQAPGWRAVPRDGPRHTVETLTPTGHRLISTAPRAPTPARGDPVDASLRRDALTRTA